MALPVRLAWPAQGGRSVEVMRAVCEVAGWFWLPKPCGAWPESVALPCAFQVRAEVVGRETLLLAEPVGREPLALLLMEPLVRAPCDNEVDGGRLVESCDWRVLLRPCAPVVVRPRFPDGELPP